MAPERLSRLQALRDHGTRAVSTYNRTLNGWDTMITERPRQRRTCTPHPTNRGLEVRCR